MSKVFYICFYSEKEYMDDLVVFPSALSKIDYMVESFKKAGYHTNVVSVAVSSKGKFKGKIINVDKEETHTYFSSMKTRFKFVNNILDVLYWIRILCYLMKNVKKNDQVIIYHSLYHRYWLHCYKKLFRKDFILQIEDVYTSVHREISQKKDMEWRLFSLTDKHICVNDILKEKLNDRGAIVSYGSYKIPKQFKNKKADKIRLVYAGVIERTRNAAFLAVEAMKYLPENYELNLLGFGTKDDIEALNILIDEINQTKQNLQVFYHGTKTGEEYIKFLQNCDIGLSTHMYQEDDMESADFTFPSKVLIYMANGLRVVAQRLEVLKKSDVGDLMFFYDVPKAEALAETILSVKLSDNYNSREKIQQLDIRFKSMLKEFLKGI